MLSSPSPSWPGFSLLVRRSRNQWLIGATKTADRSERARTSRSQIPGRRLTMTP